MVAARRSITPSPISSTWKTGAKSFESVMLTSQHVGVTNGPTPRNVSVLTVSPNFFDFLGTPAFAGRTFSRRDIPQIQNPPPLAVIGYKFWLKEFAGRNILGQNLTLGSDTYKVIGVLPPRFTWFDTDVYTLQPMQPGIQGGVSVFLKLRKGTDLYSANAELQSFTERAARRLPLAYPALPFRMYAVPLQQWLNGDKGPGRWLILVAAVCILLLIAFC